MMQSSQRGIAGKCRAELLISGMFLALSLPAAAQDAGWSPSRNVELVVGAGAGGPLDTTARTVQRIWQVRGIVDASATVVNKAGGGGVLGFKYLNDHAGDGHYLGITSTTMLTNHIVGRSPLRFTDLTPIAGLFNEYVSFGVRSDSELKTAHDLVTRLKADPTSITFSIASVLGNHNHIGVAAAAKHAGGDLRKLRVVVNKSSGESITALLGGHVDVVGATASGFVAHVKAGKIRVLGVAAPQRLGGDMAAVPTFIEQGQDVVVGAWRGVVGPRGLTAAQVAYWEGAFRKLVESPEWKSELEKRYYQNTFMTRRDLLKYLESEEASLRVTLTELGLVK